jgi:peptidyl-prolyl cis-trans isomerase D
MFDLVSKHKRLVQVLLFLIAITFATWGIESYTRFGGDRDAVATVNGLTISEREFNEELRQQHAQMRQLLGPGFDPAVFDTPEARRALLERLISQRVFAAQAAKAGLTVPDEVLQEAILSIPAFQSEGRFSKQNYEQVLRAQNPPMTPAQFEARLRYDLALAQLSQAVGDAAIAPRTVIARLAALEAQEREVSEARIPAQEFLPQVEIDDAKAKTYYDANQSAFVTPERVRVEYAVLSADALAGQDPVTEAEVKAAYEARASQYRVEEQRRASHILLETREQAEQVAAEAKKAPGRFAELAKKHSQDPGSAQNGGDLGTFGPGMMVKAFEDAVFSMKEGEISGPVQSEFGFHVIHVTGVQPERARPFEDVRKEIAEELSREKGMKKFAAAAEDFSNLVYEQPDTLKPAAERFNIPLKTSGWLTRDGDEAPGTLDHPRLLGAIFSAESLGNRRNTDAIEVVPSTLVAARVIEHQPAVQRSFEQAKDEIIERLRRQEAARLAHQAGSAKLEQLRQGAEAAVTWGPARTVSRRDPQGLSGEVLRRVVAADVSRLPAYVGMAIPEAGYLLYRITKVVDPDPKEAQSEEDEARLARLFQGSQHEAYVASLRERADIDIRQERLEVR